MSKLETLSPLNREPAPPRGRIVGLKWRHPSPPPHEFEAVVCPEEEGGFSVLALHYPGVISQGETLEEAKENIAEAFVAVLESRRKHGEDMLFSQHPVMKITPGSQRIRVTVDG